MNSSDAVTVFEISQDNIGLFAQLNYCLLLSKFCQENNLSPYFILTGKGNVDPNYGNNWFEYYFSHKQLSPKNQRIGLNKYLNGDYYKIHNRYAINKLARGSEYHEIQNELTTLREGQLLCNRYILIKDHIIKTADDYFYKSFKNGKVLGIHYRGLDKHKEAPVFTYPFVLSIIEKYKSMFDSIFLASDEPEFIKYITKNMTDKNISIYSNPSGILHFRDNSGNYQKGLNALVDSILLSKCDFLIKTPSLLSAWSKLFNPKLPVTLIGRPDLFPNNEHAIPGHGYYPESILHQDGYFKMFRNKVREVIIHGNNSA